MGPEESLRHEFGGGFGSLSRRKGRGLAPFCDEWAQAIEFSSTALSMESPAVREFAGEEALDYRLGAYRPRAGPSTKRLRDEDHGGQTQSCA